MEWMKNTKKVQDVLVKYRYAILVLAVGVALMLFPGRSSQQPVTEEIVPKQTEEVSTAEELTQILSQIKGVGKVRVMLTVLTGEVTVYQYDEDTRQGDNGSLRHETVIITDSDRNETGLVQQVVPPVFRGALVVCEGADHPSVCLAVVDAVSKVTGLGSDRISVLKMK